MDSLTTISVTHREISLWCEKLVSSFEWNSDFGEILKISIDLQLWGRRNYKEEQFRLIKAAIEIIRRHIRTEAYVSQNYPPSDKNLDAVDKSISKVFAKRNNFKS